MDLRPTRAPDPEREERTEAQPAPRPPARPEKSYVKTSVTLDRDLAVRARRYVAEQQLRYARGERASSYTFSRLFNAALEDYLGRAVGDDHDEDPA